MRGARTLERAQSAYSVMSRFQRSAPVALYVNRCMWFVSTLCTCRPICRAATQQSQPAVAAMEVQACIALRRGACTCNTAAGVLVASNRAVLPVPSASRACWANSFAQAQAQRHSAVSTSFVSPAPGRRRGWRRGGRRRRRGRRREAGPWRAVPPPWAAPGPAPPPPAAESPPAAALPSASCPPAGRHHHVSNALLYLMRSRTAGSGSRTCRWSGCCLARGSASLPPHGSDHIRPCIIRRPEGHLQPPGGRRVPKQAPGHVRAVHLAQVPQQRRTWEAR